jgi:WD40 repeat protein
MADVVCLVQATPEQVCFTWSQGPDAFPTYRLTGQYLHDFLKQIEEARASLTRLVTLYLAYLEQPSTPSVEQELFDECYRLAVSGHELHALVFNPDENPEVAQDVRVWLKGLHGQGTLNTLEMVTEGVLAGPGSLFSVPWNLLYDDEPDRDVFLSGAGDGCWAPFWGVRYNLAGGQRVNPLRRLPLTNPSVMLVIDPNVFGQMDEPFRRRFQQFANEKGFNFITSKRELKEALARGRPDLMYWLGHATPEALELGTEDDYKIRPTDLRKMLEAGGRRMGGLVFLNACRTAEASPTAGSFFNVVFGLKMSGLIATEQQTVDVFACPFGVDFLKAVLEGEPVGEAMQRLRALVPEELQLPRKVPLGILYGTYCPPELRVVRPESGVSAAQSGPPARSESVLPLPVRGKLLGTRPEVDLPPLPSRPYPSLRYYDRADRPLFSGRDSDVLRFAILLGDDETRLLVLHGESGCGKSSFLRAGVLPYLEEECVGFQVMRDRSPEGREGVLFVRATGDLAGQVAQALCAFCARPWEGRTPAEKPFVVDLPKMLAELVGEPVESARVRQRLQEDATLLGRTLAALGETLPFGVMLVIDQAEEILTLNWRQEDQPRRDRSFEMLRETLDCPGDYKLIIALRTEYYGRLVDRLRSGARDTAGVREYLLTDFDEGPLTKAILRPTSKQEVPYSSEVPFAKYGFSYADGVAEKLALQVVAETRNRQDSVLPLAQVICTQLYELACSRTDRVVHLDDLEKVGGVRGGLRKHVEGLLPSLFAQPADQRAFKRLLAGLYRRQGDGTLGTDLLPAEEAERRWGGPMPFEDMLRSTAEGDWRVLRLSVLRDEEGRERRYLSLGHDALARVAAEWDETLRRGERIRKWVGVTAAMIVVAAVMTVLAFIALRGEQAAREGADEARRQERAARRYLYAAQMNLAQRAWEENNLRVMLAYLEPHQPWPGQDDVRTFGWYYLWRVSHNDRATLRHGGAVTCLSYSGGGTTLAAAGSDGTVKLWDALTGKERAFPGGPGKLGAGRAMMYAAGERLVVATSGGPIELWDVDSLTMRVLPRKLPADTRRDALSPEGRTLALLGRDKVVRLWGLPEGQEFTSPPTGLSDAVPSLAVASDGRTAALARGDGDYSVRLWNADSDQQWVPLPRKQPFGPSRGWLGVPVRAMAFAPDGKTLAAVNDDLSVTLWDVAARKELATYRENGLTGTVHSLVFALDGKTLAVGTGDQSNASKPGMVLLWDLKTGKVRRRRGHTGPVLSVVFAPDGKTLASGSGDGTVKLWDIAGNQEWTTLRKEAQPGRIFGLAFAPDGRTLATGSEGRARPGWVHLWDMTAGKVVAALGGHDREVTSVAFAPGGKLMASGSRDGTVRLWDVDSREVRAVLEMPNRPPIHSVAFAPDGETLAAGGGVPEKPGEVFLWDVAARKLIRQLRGHKYPVLSVAFSPVGRALATAGGSYSTLNVGEIKLWDPDKGNERSPLRDPWWVRSIAFAPDGKVLAAGRADLDKPGDIKLWDMTGREAVATLRGHAHSVQSVAFAPDGKTLASGSGAGHTHHGGEVKLWDVASGQEVLTFTGYPQWVYSMAFSPTGKALATVSGDETVRVWPAATDREVVDWSVRLADQDPADTALQIQASLSRWSLYLHHDRASAEEREEARRQLVIGRDVLHHLRNNGRLDAQQEGWIKEFDSALKGLHSPSR